MKMKSRKDGMQVGMQTFCYCDIKNIYGNGISDFVISLIHLKECTKIRKKVKRHTLIVKDYVTCFCIKTRQRKNPFKVKPVCQLLFPCLQAACHQKTTLALFTFTIHPFIIID